MNLKMWSAKCRPFCPSLNVLNLSIEHCIWSSLRWDTPETHREAFAIMMVADVLVPLRPTQTGCHFTDICQCILFNTLRPRRNEQHFADDIFKRIFFNENVWISIKISLKFVPKDPINNIPALVQIMAWRRSGDKPLSEPMMVSLPTHICATRPQWVNKNWCGVFWLEQNNHKVSIDKMPVLVQMVAWCRKNDNPLSEPMMV